MYVCMYVCILCGVVQLRVDNQRVQPANQHKLYCEYGYILRVY